MRPPSLRAGSPMSLPALSSSSSFSSSSTSGPSPLPSPRLHAHAHVTRTGLSLRDSPYPSPLLSPRGAAFPRCPVIKPLPSPGAEMSPAALVMAEDGFPWKVSGGGGRVAEEGAGSPLGAYTVDAVEHATSPAHAPVAARTAPQQTPSWSHHEHHSPSYSHLSSPSSPPAASPPRHARSPHPTRNLSRHQSIKLARQTISVQTTVAPPPASYFDIDPELTATASRELCRDSTLSSSGMVAGGRSRAPRGLKPLTAIQGGRSGSRGSCPLRSILGAPTPPLRVESGGGREGGVVEVAK